MHQYAHLGKGKTIHSSGQIEYYKNTVDDKSSKVGGKQHIVTLDCHIIPLNICNGLAYMDMSKPMDVDSSSLPHVVFTSDSNWDPTTLNSEFDPDVDWQDAQEEDFFDPHFYDTGNYLHCHAAFLDAFTTSKQQMDIDDLVDSLICSINHNQVISKEPDFEALHPCLAWALAETLLSIPLK